LISSPQMMHATVMASFPSFNMGGRVLWRIDNLGPSTYAIVQSDEKPDFHHVVDQFGWPASDQRWDTIEYDGFLNNIADGQIWRFRLMANPTHSISDMSQYESRGKVMAHMTVDQQKKWLIDRSQKLGFIIENASQDIKEPALEIRQNEVKRFSHGNEHITFNAVTFEGILRVDDRELLVSSMKKGIGRAKGYGCGLLTVARLK
jgi:CRISPR system Cascade subunit CasE